MTTKTTMTTDSNTPKTYTWAYLRQKLRRGEPPHVPLEGTRIHHLVPTPPVDRGWQSTPSATSGVASLAGAKRREMRKKDREKALQAARHSILETARYHGFRVWNHGTSETHPFCRLWGGAG